jgi:hypothetical protein
MRLDSGSNKSQKQISSQLSEPPSGGFLLSTTPLKQELAVLVSAKSIGITRVGGNTTPLLPKALPKPPYGWLFFWRRWSAIGQLIFINMRLS